MTDPAEYISGRTVQEQMNQLISYVDTRAAEVATSAIASDVADVAQAKTDAESARDAAIAAKDTAVATVSDCVKKTPAAAQTITGQDLIVSGADVEAVDLRASGDLSVGDDAAVTGDATVGGTLGVTGKGTIATPAATDPTSTIVNMAYVSDTGGSLNNLLHKNGEETVSSAKTLLAQWDGIVGHTTIYRSLTAAEVSASTVWTEIMSFTSNFQHMRLRIRRCFGNNDSVTDALISVQTTTVGTCAMIDTQNLAADIAFEGGFITVAIDSSSVVHVFMNMKKTSSTYRPNTVIEVLEYYNPYNTSAYKLNPPTFLDVSPVAEPDWSNYTSYKAIA